MEILIKPENQLTEDESRQVGEVCRLAFAGEEGDIAWTEHEDWHVLVKVEGQVVSRIGIVDRLATVGGQPVRLGGIGGVATHPDHRRKGYAAQAMEAADQWMINPMGVDFGLLICADHMIQYYGRFGWRLVAHSMWIEQPQGRISFDANIMILPCVQSNWPGGEIDLCGRPW